MQLIKKLGCFFYIRSVKFSKLLEMCFFICNDQIVWAYDMKTGFKLLSIKNLQRRLILTENSRIIQTPIKKYSLKIMTIFGWLWYQYGHITELVPVWSWLVQCYLAGLKPFWTVWPWLLHVIINKKWVINLLPSLITHRLVMQQTHWSAQHKSSWFI